MTMQLRSRSAGATMVLTLSDPTAQSLLNASVCVAGTEAINAAERNPDVRSVVLTSDGLQFCMGFAKTASAREVLATAHALDTWCEALRQFSKPVVLAIEGACHGAGLALAVAGDAIVAAHNSRWSCDFLHATQLPVAGTSIWLSRQLPRALALPWLMGGYSPSVQRLHQVGMITHLTEPGTALDEALDMASRLNYQPAELLSSIKDVFNACDQDPPAHIRQLELSVLATRVGATSGPSASGHAGDK